MVNNTNGASLTNSIIYKTLDQYYTVVDNTAFYSLSSTYLWQYYWTMVRQWDYWNNGYVPTFHSAKNGTLPTKLGTSISRKIADIIYGDGVFYSSVDNLPTDALTFISGEYERKNHLNRIIKDSIHKACALGNCLLKLNVDEDAQCYPQAISGNRFFVDLDSRGNIIKAQSYVDIFTISGGQGSQGAKETSYGLVEERYYNYNNGVKTPVVTYAIYPLQMANIFVQPSGAKQSIQYENLPRRIQKLFRENYNSIYLGEETLLPFTDLGCYLIKYTDYVNAMPNVKLGESCLADVLNYLAMYDTIWGEIGNDTFISRGRVLVPTFMRDNKQGEMWTNLDTFTYTQVPSKSDKDQTPQAIQFSLRIKEFEQALNCIKVNIASTIGVSTASLFPDLQKLSGTVTATQITVETSNTALFSANKHEIMVPTFNAMITQILRFYGYADEIVISLGNDAGTSKAIQLDNIKTQLELGTMTRKTAIRNLNPSWDEEKIENELSLQDDVITE